MAKIFESSEILRHWNKDKLTIDGFHLPEMTGGVNPGDQRAIYYLIHHLQPKSILEVGTLIGCSTVSIALAASQATSREWRLLTVDIQDVNDESARPWLRYGSNKSPKQMIQEIGCQDCVSFVRADSVEFLKQSRLNFDFIFLDGDHEFERVHHEIVLSFRHLCHGGFILLHDYFPDLKPLWSDGSLILGPREAVQRISQEGAEIIPVPLGTLPWPTKLDSNVTSLCLVSSRS